MIAAWLDITLSVYNLKNRYIIIEMWSLNLCLLSVFFSNFSQLSSIFILFFAINVSTSKIQRFPLYY